MGKLKELVDVLCAGCLGGFSPERPAVRAHSLLWHRGCLTDAERSVYGDAWASYPGSNCGVWPLEADRGKH